MTIRQQWTLVGTIIAVVAITLAVASYAMKDELFPIAAGVKAPAVTGRTLDSPPVQKTLKDYAGNVVLLNIWATFCEPCRVEMPSMDTLYQEFRNRGLKVVAVSVDAPGSEDLIKKFVTDYNLTFDILYDPDQKTMRAYRGSGYPESFVIGRDGVIRRVEYSSVPWTSASNRALFAQLLSEGTEGPASAP